MLFSCLTQLSSLEAKLLRKRTLIMGEPDEDSESSNEAGSRLVFFSDARPLQTKHVAKILRQARLHFWSGVGLSFEL